MAPLPMDRVRRARPFENTGCDLIGPYSLKGGSKIYICLYTCLTTRAIHLEVVENLSASAFLDSFVRFSARRGVPKLVRTDCGSNFVLGQKVIDSLYTHDRDTERSINRYCAENRINWVFNPPGAPWMGGVWERLVGSVKLALQKSVGRKRLAATEMNTVVTRIEAILNTRPITGFSSTDVCAIPLRPVDFLQGNVCFSLPAADPHQDDDPSFDEECIQTVAQAKEALAYSERIADKFLGDLEYRILGHAQGYS
ncbi:unnamed protein product [Heligmosomoides polygyrus]|uniref:Integrase catalytic domain-containing protein n=1 Tax=Heligmosomoides polygyrus TaxID=6339 RepID=A0A183FKQ6_HELPZ|nr:unnamed protein product [Heligmosomoides polygyrus]